MKSRATTKRTLLDSGTRLPAALTEVSPDGLRDTQHPLSNKHSAAAAKYTFFASAALRNKPTRAGSPQHTVDTLFTLLNTTTKKTKRPRPEPIATQKENQAKR